VTDIPSLSLRGTECRSNLPFGFHSWDCFAPLAITGNDPVAA